MSHWTFKLLYDGECPFCVREVALLRRRNHAGRLAFEDISSPEVDPAQYGTTRDELLRVIHGVFPDGRIVRKVEVFRQAYRAVGFGWLVAPTGWPLLRPMVDWAYEIFARHRIALGRLFGRACETGTCAVPRRSGDR